MVHKLPQSELKTEPRRTQEMLLA